MFVVSMNNPVRGILYRSLQYEGVNGERESSMEVLHLICMMYAEEFQRTFTLLRYL